MAEKNILSTEKISKLFWKLSIPAIIAQLVNLLYNMVDRMYIGHIKDVGHIALTGVGVSMPLLMIVSAFAMLIGAGGAPRASIALGAGNQEEAEQIMNTATITAFIVGIVLAGLGLVFREPLLLAFGASSESLPYAMQYIEIYLLGSPAVMASLGLNFFISAQGFAGTAMKTTLIGAILNIILDPIFIFGFNMGTRGAALATVISQYISAAWVVKFFFSKKSQMRISWLNLRIKPQYLGQIVSLGLSPFIMHLTESLLQITFNRTLFKFGGDLYVGTMAINSLIMQFIFMPIAGLAQGATPIISYNYGAEKPERVKQTIKLLIASSVIYTTVFGLFIQFFPDLLIGMFTTEPALIAATRWTMRIFCFGVFFLGFQVSCQQSFIAFGQAKISAFMALLRKVILLIPLILLLPRFMTDNPVFGVYLAEPITDFIAAATTTIVFFNFVRKELAF